MSTWRNVWRESIRAFVELARASPRGEALFERLLSRHPDDGMVILERGEGRERAGRRDQALADYRAAAAALTVPQWQHVALVEERRLAGQDPPSGIPPLSQTLADRFHALHDFPGLPPHILADAMSAAARLESEPHLAAIEFRACLEALAWRKLQARTIPCEEKQSLGQSLDLMRLYGLVREASNEDSGMRKVLEDGNRAAHRRSDDIRIDGRALFAAFLEVARWYCATGR